MLSSFLLSLLLCESMLTLKFMLILRLEPVPHQMTMLLHSPHGAVHLASAKIDDVRTWTGSWWAYSYKTLHYWMMSSFLLIVSAVSKTMTSGWRSQVSSAWYHRDSWLRARGYCWALVPNNKFCLPYSEAFLVAQRCQHPRVGGLMCQIFSWYYPHLCIVL